jgi:hypothetical protein
MKDGLDGCRRRTHCHRWEDNSVSQSRRSAVLSPYFLSERVALPSNQQYLVSLNFQALAFVAQNLLWFTRVPS